MKPTRNKTQHVLMAFAVLTLLFPLATTYHGRSVDLPAALMNTDKIMSFTEDGIAASCARLASQFLDQTGVSWVTL